MYKRLKPRIIAFVMAMMLLVQDCGLVYATEAVTNVGIVNEIIENPIENITDDEQEISETENEELEETNKESGEVEEEEELDSETEVGESDPEAVEPELETGEPELEIEQPELEEEEVLPSESVSGNDQLETEVMEVLEEEIEVTASGEEIFTYNHPCRCGPCACRLFQGCCQVYQLQHGCL